MQSLDASQPLNQPFLAFRSSKAKSQARMASGIVDQLLRESKHLQSQTKSIFSGCQNQASAGKPHHLLKSYDLALRQSTLKRMKLQKHHRQWQVVQQLADNEFINQETLKHILPKGME